MAERPLSESSAIPEPSPAARELLRAFRAHESPSAAERDEGFVALRARLDTEAPAPPAAANSRFYGIAKATLVTVAVAAAVLLAIKAVGSGVTALADRARQPAVEAPYQGEAGADGGQAVARSPRLLPPRRSDGAPAEVAEEQEAAVIDSAAPAADPTPPDAAGSPSSSGSSSSAPAARSSRPRASGSTASTAVDAIEEEFTLIKRGAEAKKTRRWSDGLAALREHAQRFPTGVLAEERMVLQAELYCGAGRVQEAYALVEAFLRDRAGSALTGRMRNVCRE